MAVMDYLRNRGTYQWTTILQNFPLRYRKLGMEQDAIGWDGFTMGMVSTEFHHIQADHLAMSPSQLSHTKWKTHFITHFLQITHCQWVYRNEIVHNRDTGKEHKNELQSQQTLINVEQEQGLEDLLPQDHCLQEIPEDEDTEESWTRQQYWLLAVKTARRAASLERQPRTGVG